MFQYEAKVIRVVDGDTLWLKVDLGFKIWTEINCRLAGLNAPDTVEWKDGGLNDPARNYINQAIPQGATCVVDIDRTEKWGRWLGTIRYLKDCVDRNEIIRSGRNLNEELVKFGFAKAYHGEKK